MKTVSRIAAIVTVLAAMIGFGAWQISNPNYPQLVASRVLTAQTSVDGSGTAATLYTIPTAADGIYRVSAFAVARTKSSSAWLVSAMVGWPAGTNLATPTIAMQINMNTGAISSNEIYYGSVYLHAADVIQCGTITTSGSNTGGNFDVSWTVERLQ